MKSDFVSSTLSLAGDNQGRLLLKKIIKTIKIIMKKKKIN
jgi:hypothetical protein